MHKITLLALTAVTAVMFAACAAPVENKPLANTNVNAAKPAAAPPTVAALLSAVVGDSSESGPFVTGFALLAAVSAATFVTSTIGLSSRLRARASRRVGNPERAVP
jgi:hypothetical protein